jgi:hypothetical protein
VHVGPDNGTPAAAEDRHPRHTPISAARRFPCGPSAQFDSGRGPDASISTGRPREHGATTSATAPTARIQYGRVAGIARHVDVLRYAARVCRDAYAPGTAERGLEQAGDWILPQPFPDTPERINQSWVSQIAEERGLAPIVVIGQLQKWSALTGEPHWLRTRQPSQRNSPLGEQLISAQDYFVCRLNSAGVDG